MSAGVQRVEFDEMTATHVHAHATAGEPRDKPVEELVEVGTKHDELEEVIAEQARQQVDKVGHQDEGSSDMQQVVGDHDVCPVDLDKVADEGEELVYWDELVDVQGDELRTS